MSLVTDGASFTPAVRHFADAGDRLSARTAPDAEADASLSRAPGWTRGAVLVLRLLCSRLTPKLCVCFSLEVSRLSWLSTKHPALTRIRARRTRQDPALLPVSCSPVVVLTGLGIGLYCHDSHFRTATVNSNHKPAAKTGLFSLASRVRGCAAKFRSFVLSWMAAWIYRVRRRPETIAGIARLYTLVKYSLPSSLIFTPVIACLSRARGRVWTCVCALSRSLNKSILRR